jgi:hypothetical protein
VIEGAAAEMPNAVEIGDAGRQQNQHQDADPGSGRLLRDARARRGHLLAETSQLGEQAGPFQHIPVRDVPRQFAS